MVTEENFKAYQGFDLTNWDVEPSSEAAPKIHRVLRTMNVMEFTRLLAENQKIPPERVRLWVMVNRQNKTVRPDQPLLDPHMKIDEAYTKYGTRDKHFRLWLEVATTIEEGKPVWPDMQPQASINLPVLIFLKYFDIDNQTLLGVGHIYMKKLSKVADMVPLIYKMMAGSPLMSSSQLVSKATSTALLNGSGHANSLSAPPLALYEEIKHSMIEPMKPKATLQQAEIQDGDIVCFQRSPSEKESVLFFYSIVVFLYPLFLLHWLSIGWILIPSSV